MKLGLSLLVTVCVAQDLDGIDDLGNKRNKNAEVYTTTSTDYAGDYVPYVPDGSEYEAYQAPDAYGGGYGRSTDAPTTTTTLLPRLHTTSVRTYTKKFLF